MQGLEKILEEIEKLHGEAGSECTSEDHYVKRAWEQCIKCVEDIIRKHINDGWIPVEERMPENNKPGACLGEKHCAWSRRMVSWKL